MIIKNNKFYFENKQAIKELKQFFGIKGNGIHV